MTATIEIKSNLFTCQVSKLILTKSFENYGSLAICEQDDHTIVTCLSEIALSLKNFWFHPQSHVFLIQDPKHNYVQWGWLLLYEGHLLVLVRRAMSLPQCHTKFSEH